MRRLLIVGATLALLAVGLVAGPSAHANTEAMRCAANDWPTTTEILDNPTGPYLAVEWYSSWLTDGRGIDDDNWINICYSDTPGMQPSSAIGGAIHLRLTQVGFSSYSVQVICWGDSPTWLATVNCDTTATVHVNTVANTEPAAAGVAVSGLFLVNGSTLALGTTGAYTGTLSTTSGSNPDVTYGGTCVAVAGVSPVGCAAGIVDADIAPGDVTPTTFVEDPRNVCLVQLGGCVLYQPKVGVVLFNDTNATTVGVLGTQISDPGRTCIGIGC